MKVLEPIRIRNLDVPNRIVRAAHGTALGSPPSLLGGEDFVGYHAARAAGGVGLTILEAASVHASSGGLASCLDDGVVERYEGLMEAVRPHGMRVFQQLFHAGSIYPSPLGTAWGVSTVPAPNGGIGAPMTAGQIAEVVAAYAAAARRCRDGGLDGVEVHAAHGYLPAQFLSPIYNTRTDEYGGPLENRLRFSREVLTAIRAEVGDDLVVGIRLGASEMPGSIQEPELRSVIQMLEADGLIDYLMTTWGDYYRMFTMGAGPELPAGYELPSAGQLTEAATVPSIVNGRFRTLAEAEQVLADGVADMVSLVRALIADPDVVRKTREGRAAEIRPCIACNQGCIGGIASFPLRLGCTVNPAAGFEATLAEILRAERPRRVLVVGGGPAGLEAARVAALAGHEVKLVEAEPALGGALAAARRAPRFALLGEIADWLAASVEQAGVEVVLGTRLSADDVVAEGADAVVVATGSTPRLAGFQPARPFEPARGVELPHVLSSAALLGGGVPASATGAVVLDTVGHFEAIAAAGHLVGQGLAVTFVTSLSSFGGPAVHATHRDVPELLHLYGGDFTLLVRHHLVEIGPSSCVVRPLESERTSELPADVVVLVTQNEPSRGLYDELVARGLRDVSLVGDASTPRDLQAAIAEGHRAARAAA
jgi:2,4-dienoyl-CoA reductase-like NADH-dependent reductase (Old Yellow Enzyme family)